MTHPDPNDISSYIHGKTEWLTSSPSNSIALSLSFQEDQIFLACPNTSVTSYNEDDRSSNDLLNEYSAAGEQFSDLTEFIAPSGDHKPRKNKMSAKKSLLLSSLHPNSKPSDLPASILRGSLVMKISKPTKIKDITVRFYGKCKTEWLESNVEEELGGSGPISGTQFYDELVVSSHSWRFVGAPVGASPNASLVTIENTSVVSTDLYGADVASIIGGEGKKSKTGYSLKFKTPSVTPISTSDIPQFSPTYFDDDKIQSTIGKIGPESSAFESRHGKSVVYPAGQYVFNFTIAIDARTSETIVCTNGAIKYFVAAKVSRSSRFAMNVSCQKEIQLIRSPPNLADMTSHGPLNISRDWDGRLQYEISCPTAYIPLGTHLPLTIKLTPIEKVRLHRIKVQIVEDVTYISSWVGQMRHHEPLKKLLCFYKTASEKNRKKETKVPKSSGNLLELDNSFAGTTQFDATIPFPEGTSPIVLKDAANFLRPDACFNPMIHVKHRLHVSFRISKHDFSDAERKYYEVLVDVPIHFLSKYCQSESIELPEYTDSLSENEIGMPLVHALSSQFSRSPELAPDSTIPNIDFLALDDNGLPSFDDSQFLHNLGNRRSLFGDMNRQNNRRETRRQSSSSGTSEFTSSDESAMSTGNNDILPPPPLYESVVTQTQRSVV